MPLARLCLLSSCEERRWPSGQKDGYGDLSAYTMRLYFKRAHAIKHDLCFGTLFLVDKKAGSNAVEIIRGLPRPSQMLPHLP